MSKAITFNVDGLIKQLDLIEKAYLPDAAKSALKSFGFDAREILQDEMKRQYGAVTPFTLRSPYFKIQNGGYGLLIGISEKANGTPPSRYLAPTDKTGGVSTKPVAPTSFAGALRARYGVDEIPVPVRSSRAGSQFIDKRGNLKGRKVQKLVNELNSSNASLREQYFLIKPAQSRTLSGGIYRRYRVKNQISPVFTFKAKPTQATSLDFHGVLIKAAQQRLPALIQKKLDRLLR